MKSTWNPKRPPPEHLLETHPVVRIDLSGDATVVLIQEMRWYRGRVYRFCLTLAVVEGGHDLHAERVDTCHGSIHRHRLCSSGAAEDKIEICPFEPGDHGLITLEMDRAYDNYLSSWPQRVDEWRAR